MSGTDKRIPGTEAAERRSERIETKCLYTKSKRNDYQKSFLFCQTHERFLPQYHHQRTENKMGKLILAPPEVLDYVVVHELCHLKEMNHSKAFWDEVGKVMPEYETYKLWLKENGWKL